MTRAELNLKRLISRFLFFFALVSCSLVGAQDLGFDSEDEFLPVEQAYQVIPEVKDSTITLHWTVADGYYLYQERFKLSVTNAQASQEIELVFEPGERKYDEYFEKELVLYYFNTQMQGELPKISPPYELLVRSMGCADAGLCYPPRKQYFLVDTDGTITEKAKTSFSPPAASQSPAENAVPASTEPAQVPAPSASRSLWAYLVFALVGGMILNLMPCVFPVLSLKALSFASANMNPHHQHVHGWAYTGGVVASFLIAGIIILAGREIVSAFGGAWNEGGEVGWGAQMQVPGFVIAMVYLFYLMGLSLAGMFHIGTQWMGVGQGLTSGHGLRASFFTGILAALVASPCTGPLMAPALGATLLLPFFQGLLIFLFLGFGMALPFLVLSYNPKLAQKLPAPGAWMDTLKQFLAFPMFLTCIWLLWVLGHQTSSDGATLVILGAVLLTFAIWLHNLKKKPGLMQKIILLTIFASVIAAFGAAWNASKMKASHVSSSEIWVPYTPDKLQELRNQGTPVFVDLTADWCITCKVNERVALTEEVEQYAKEKGIVLMIGDWTNSNPDISDLLKKYHRSGVPLYLMYPADPTGPAEVLPQLLRSQSVVLDAMERAL